MDFRRNHTPRRGGYTQGSKYTPFSNITPNLRRARGGYTPTPHIQHITSNLRRARPPHTPTPQNQHITPNLRRARGGYTPTPRIQDITPNLRRARPPPTPTPQNQHITPNPYNPLQPKNPMPQPLTESASRLMYMTAEIPLVRLHPSRSYGTHSHMYTGPLVITTTTPSL
jgi:hypothetical protein